MSERCTEPPHAHDRLRWLHLITTNRQAKLIWGLTVCAFCTQMEQAARRAAEARLAETVAERTALQARLAAEAAANARQAVLLVDAQVHGSAGKYSGRP